MELAEQFCDRTDPIESSLYFGMKSLDKCYAALSGAFPCTKDVLREHSTAFAEHFSSLERVRPRMFHTKPKLQLLGATRVWRATVQALELSR